MDGTVFTVFVLAAFLGGFVSGFSGFAMGLVVSGVWLHIITPIHIGLGNGLLGGLTGLGGVISTISCQLRGWPKDLQRSVFQPVLFAAFVIISMSLGIAGAVTADTLKLYALGVPFLLTGLWAGFKLYGKIDDETFRKAVSALLLLSGLSLIASAIIRAPVRV